MDKNKTTIEDLKILKSIKADEGFKFSLRKRIFEEAGKSFVTDFKKSRLDNRQSMSILQICRDGLDYLSIRRKNILIPLLFIVALLGGGAGTAYASQNSLPGDALYPIKIAIEEVEAVLTIKDIKEVKLRANFSKKRLEEVEKLVERKMARPELIESAIEIYKKELAISQDILNSAIVNQPNQTAEVAEVIAGIMVKNKEILIRISGKIDDDKVLDKLKEAWEEAIERGDSAMLVLLANPVSSSSASSSDANNNMTSNTSATSGNTTANTANNAIADSNANSNTVTVILDPLMQNRVLNKISEVARKISEAEKDIIAKEVKGLDVSADETQIATAKILLIDAQNLLNQAKYQEAFLTAREAHQKSKIAKEAEEHNSKKNDKK